MAYRVGTFAASRSTAFSIIALELVGGANGLLQRAGMWPPLLWMAAASCRMHMRINQQPRDEYAK